MKVFSELAVTEGPACTIGEGPMWSPGHQAVFWLDTVGKRILRSKLPFVASEVRALPYKPSALVLTDCGDLLLGYKKGIGLFDFDSGRYVQLPCNGVDFVSEIFNDGACDAQGRFWIGTRDRQVTEPVGALYSIDADLLPRRVVDCITVSNGIAWSPDKSVMYHVDSRPGSIVAFDFHPDTGTLSNRRLFLDYAGLKYRPDGCTTDSEGFLWVAEVEGGQVSRYGPDGSLDISISLPVSKPTSVMFGGRDLSTLFVTSMRFGLTEEELRQQPLAGKLLRLTLDVPGLPEKVFRTHGSKCLSEAHARLHDQSEQ